MHRILSLLLVFSTLVAAADLKVRVIDPQSDAVSGAQLMLFEGDRSLPADIRVTAADGTAFLHSPNAECRLRVLAPGFAPEEVPVGASQSEVRVKLRLATAAETVVVSATRTPVPEDQSGASVSSLRAQQLTALLSDSSADALRFIPGAIVNTAGQRGGLASLFVRGGDSRYNKVIIDSVPVNDPGGTFDFGVVPLEQVDRLELLRGAQSTLYGSDAMTSVVQIWTKAGSTAVPELRFGADGGNFNTADGYLSLTGARGRFDYNIFGNQFNTQGQGANNGYSNSSQGANLGVRLSQRISFRVRTRHSNSRTSVSSFWNFNGQTLLPPDTDQWARQNNLLGDVEMTISGNSRWEHRFSGFDYSHRRANVEYGSDAAARISPLFGPIDLPFSIFADINRAGLEYQGNYIERGWAHSTFGSEFEDENGFFGNRSAPDHGLRRNYAVYGQQALVMGRLSVVAGARFVHNQTFGNKGVPRVALTLQALRGGEFFSGTRLRFSYATGIKQARFEESFASGPFILPNRNLKAEENRAFEAGLEQSLAGGRFSLSAVYFNNLFRNQIDFSCCDANGNGEYVNIDKSMAQGAEVEFQGRPLSRLSWNLAYNYLSTQILNAPFAFDPLLSAGEPLLRRPKHSGSFLLSYMAKRWGGNLVGTLVGRRPDSDFEGFNIDHAAGYARVDVGGWYALTSRVTAYINLENVLNKHYNEVVGYPALGTNFRIGMRFRLGGE